MRWKNYDGSCDENENGKDEINSVSSKFLRVHLFKTWTKMKICVKSDDKRWAAWLKKDKDTLCIVHRKEKDRPREPVSNWDSVSEHE